VQRRKRDRRRLNCPHCRRKVRLLPKTARQRRNSATVALFCDSVDRLLVMSSKSVASSVSCYAVHATQAG